MFFQKITTLPVETLATNLWCYSKNREILTESCDTVLLEEELAAIENSITQSMTVLSQNVKSDVIDMLNETVSQVYNGAIFNDENYNELIELPWTEFRFDNCDIK